MAVNIEAQVILSIYSRGCCVRRQNFYKMVFEICFVDIVGVSDFSAHFNKWHLSKIFYYFQTTKIFAA